MQKFKAVEFMREARNKLTKLCAGLTPRERVESTRKELKKDPFWREFLKRRRKLAVK